MVTAGESTIEIAFGRGVGDGRVGGGLYGHRGLCDDCRRLYDLSLFFVRAPGGGGLFCLRPVLDSDGPLAARGLVPPAGCALGLGLPFPDGHRHATAQYARDKTNGWGGRLVGCRLVRFRTIPFPRSAVGQEPGAIDHRFSGASHPISNPFSFCPCTYEVTHSTIHQWGVSRVVDERRAPFPHQPQHRPTVG